jgi:hypothetical protein
VVGQQLGCERRARRDHGFRLEHPGVLTGDEQEQSDAVLYRRQRVEGERKAVER